MNNVTVIIRIITGVLTIVCWIFAFILFRKKPGTPGELLIIMFGCACLLMLIAEHINNYFVRRKK